MPGHQAENASGTHRHQRPARPQGRLADSPLTFRVLRAASEHREGAALPTLAPAQQGPSLGQTPVSGTGPAQGQGLGPTSGQGAAQDQC